MARAQIRLCVYYHTVFNDFFNLSGASEPTGKCNNVKFCLEDAEGTLNVLSASFLTDGKVRLVVASWISYDV